MSIFVNKELIEEIEISEIDFDLKDEFKNSNNDDERVEFVEKGQSTMTNATPISIDRLEKLLTEFKEKGATHVEMEYHGDHFGYLFAAFKIYK